MSTKAKRASTATPQPQPGSTSTPIVPMASQPDVTSPTRHSRFQEKVELANLNDRLAAYIDKVRFLENENAHLKKELTTERETVSYESVRVKSIYETELNDARKLLDETSREKAKLEIDYKRAWELNEELKAKLDKKTKDCTIAENNARLYETRVADLSNKYNAACGERKRLGDEVNELQRELDRLVKQLEDARKNLEDETLARVDLENTIQSLREELTFKDQVHIQELNETRSRRQVEVTEIDGQLSDVYEARLQRSLQELRDSYEASLRSNREEIELLYENNIKELQAAVNRSKNAANSASEELRTSRTRIDGMNCRIGELEKLNSSLNGRIRDLEQLLDHERTRHSADMANLEAELHRIREEMEQQAKEYQDLMDIKLSLDMEIAAYDKLLCGEESRLNITPTTAHPSGLGNFSQSMRSSRSTPIRKTPLHAGVKRKRTVEDSEDFTRAEYFVSGTAKADIEIADIDNEGKYVKLRNKGSNDISIGSWQIIRVAGKNETLFKFHHSTKVLAGATITIWSSDTGVTHDPPTNIVMKSQKWFVGDNMKTVLKNGDGEEMATSERVKRSIHKHTSHHRSLGSTRHVVDSSIGEELYHQQGDPQSSQHERCHIM